METNLPYWDARLEVTRPAAAPGFDDIAGLLPHHYRLHEEAVNFLGPYNARQRAAVNGTYVAPSREELRQSIRQGAVNDFTYQAFIGSLERFCYLTRGKKALPTPHPAIIHSIQLPRPAFELEKDAGAGAAINLIGFKVPLLVRQLRHPRDYRFLIVRPRQARPGVVSTRSWEVLLFKTNFGYLPEWVDSDINPRWCGVI